MISRWSFDVLRYTGLQTHSSCLSRLSVLAWRQQGAISGKYTGFGVRPKPVTCWISLSWTPLSQMSHLLVEIRVGMRSKWENAWKMLGQSRHWRNRNPLVGHCRLPFKHHVLFLLCNRNHVGPGVSPSPVRKPQPRELEWCFWGLTTEAPEAAQEQRSSDSQASVVIALPLGRISTFIQYDN